MAFDLLKESFRDRNIRLQEKRRWQKKLYSGLKKCPGHWIYKGSLRNTTCYNESGKCLICGAWK